MPYLERRRSYAPSRPRGVEKAHLSHIGDYLPKPEDADAKYADVEPSLARHSAFDGVDDGQRRALFEAHVVRCVLLHTPVRGHFFWISCQLFRCGTEEAVAVRPGFLNSSM